MAVRWVRVALVAAVLAGFALVCAATAERAAANPYVPQGGTIAADSGFRPETNGYSFENYTNDNRPVNLTPAEMIEIFGPGVCASRIQGGQCVLTAPAKLTMSQWNQGMGGGHCYGMAATAHFFYYGIGIPAQVFGSPSVPALQLANPNLQRQIAYGFVFQNFDSVNRSAARGTPSQVLSATADALNAGAPVVIGFYMPDKTGGHAVTPIFIEDRGNGVFDMVVYDNNFPGQYRTIVVDTNNEAWDYFGGTDPSNATSRYVGDAQTQSIELHYLQPGLTQQPCSFCRGRAVAKQGGETEVAPADTTLFVETNGNGEQTPRVEIDNGDGASSTFNVNEEGELISDNGIPGAELRFPFLDGVEVWEEKPLPTVNLPDGDYKVDLRGGDIEGSPDQDVALVRDGVSFELQNLELKDGEEQSVKFDGDELVFDNEEGEDEGVKVRFGFTGDEDYLFTLAARRLEEDSRLVLDVDQRKGDLNLETKGDQGRYSLEVQRTEGDETVELTDEKIKSKQGKELTLDIDKWREGDDSAPIDRD